MTDEVKTDTKVIPETIVSQSNTSQAPNDQESEQQINWKKFKDARAKEREQAEIIAKRAQEKEAENIALKAALESALNRQPVNQYQEPIEESEEQIIEKKVNAILSKREQEAEKIRRAREEEELPNRLKNTHKDFEQVCSADNLDYLEYHHPELARALGSKPQSAEKWNDIYNAIKRYIPNTSTSKDQNKAQQNLNKPVSISSAGVTQGANAMPPVMLSEERKRANWERMQKTLKSVAE